MARALTPRRDMARLTIGRRFGMVALVVVPLVALACVIGALGAGRVNSQVSELYEHAYTHTLQSAELSRTLAAAEAAALHVVLTNDGAAAERLNLRLDRRLLPAVDSALATAKSSVGAAEGRRAVEAFSCF